MHGRHDSEERRDDEDAHEEDVRGDLIDHVRRHVEEVDEKEWRRRGVKLLFVIPYARANVIRFGPCFSALKRHRYHKQILLEENGEKLREVRRLGRRVRVQPLGWTANDDCFPTAMNPGTHASEVVEDGRAGGA